MSELNVGATSYIWGARVNKSFQLAGGIGDGNKVSAPAEFIFVGIRHEDLLPPSVILTVEFRG